MSQVIAAFFVGGRPRTKGSMKVITPRGRKPIMVEDHAHSKPWRAKLVKAIKARYPDMQPTSAPISINCDFYFERNGPTAAVLPYPTLNAGVNAAGDLDKLIRNLLDALQESGMILDDCQVVSLISTKNWAGSLGEAGVHVTVLRRVLP